MLYKKIENLENKQLNVHQIYIFLKNSKRHFEHNSNKIKMIAN